MLQKGQFFDVDKGPGLVPGTCIFKVTLNFSSVTLGFNFYPLFHEEKLSCANP